MWSMLSLALESGHEFVGQWTWMAAGGKIGGRGRKGVEFKHLKRYQGTVSPLVKKTPKSVIDYWQFTEKR